MLLQCWNIRFGLCILLHLIQKETILALFRHKGFCWPLILFGFKCGKFMNGHVSFKFLNSISLFSLKVSFLQFFVWFRFLFEVFFLLFFVSLLLNISVADSATHVTCTCISACSSKRHNHCLTINYSYGNFLFLTNWNIPFGLCILLHLIQKETILALFRHKGFCWPLILFGFKCGKFMNGHVSFKFLNSISLFSLKVSFLQFFVWFRFLFEVFFLLFFVSLLLNISVADSATHVTCTCISACSSKRHNHCLTINYSYGNFLFLTNWEQMWCVVHSSVIWYD